MSTCRACGGYGVDDDLDPCPDCCHCGRPVYGVRDGIDLGPAARALCEVCLPVRCDVEPGACSSMHDCGYELDSFACKIRHQGPPIIGWGKAVDQ